jgi:hypothetical protein
MDEIAAALDAERVQIADGVDRSGWRGFLRSGLDAVKRSTEPLLHFETAYPLEQYQLVILGTPVWAGRCSSVVRSFLKSYGDRLSRVAYLLTRGAEVKYEEIYAQMDRYTAAPHVAAVSLRSGSVGYHFQQEEFLRQVRGLIDRGE